MYLNLYKVCGIQIREDGINDGAHKCGRSLRTRNFSEVSCSKIDLFNGTALSTPPSSIKFYLGTLRSRLEVYKNS